MLKDREGHISKGGQKKQKPDRAVGLTRAWLRMCPFEGKVR